MIFNIEILIAGIWTLVDTCTVDVVAWLMQTDLEYRHGMATRCVRIAP